MRPSLDKFLDQLRRSPFGKQLETEIERQARAAEALHDARVRAFQSWHDAESKKEQLSALRAKLRAAEETYRKTVTAAAREVAAARQPLQLLEQEIAHTQRRALAVLQDTEYPVVRDAADVWYTIFRARAHVQAHSTTTAPQLRESLRDVRAAMGGQLHPDDERLAAEVERIDRAEAVLPAFDAALERLRSVQLEVAPDLEKIVDEVTATLPTRCPICDQRLDLRGEIKKIMGREHEAPNPVPSPARR